MRKLLIPLVLVSIPFTAFSQLSYGTDVTGNLLVPTSSFGDAFGTGFGGTVGVFFDVEPNLRVTMSGGYNSIGVDQGGITELYQQAGGTGTIDAEGSTKVIPLLLGLQLITPGKVRVYGAFEAGLYIYNVSASAIITENNMSSNVQLANETRTEFGVNFGFGALMPLKDELSLSAGMRYHFVKTSEFRSTEGGASAVTLSTNQYLSLSLGLNWSFPL